MSTTVLVTQDARGRQSLTWVKPFIEDEALFDILADLLAALVIPGLAVVSVEDLACLQEDPSDTL